MCEKFETALHVAADVTYATEANAGWSDGRRELKG